MAQPRWFCSLGRIVTAGLIGIMCVSVSPPSSLIATSAYALPSSARSLSGCSPASQPQAGIAAVIAPNYNLYGVESQISFNSTDLGVGYVNCVDNAYWVGMQTENSSGCGGYGQFAQDGWVAVYNAQNKTVTYPEFTEYYQAARFTGCGDHEVYLGSAASTTYEVNFQQNNCNPAGPGGYLDFIASGSLLSQVCAQWNSGNTQLDVSTELQGSTNHAGAVGFWWTEYCLSQGCTPNTEPSSVRPSNGGLAEVYIGTHGVSDTWWPNWNTCDVHDFSSSNC